MKYKSSGVNNKEKIAISRAETSVQEYVATMRRAMSDRKYTLPEASLRLPFDTALLEESRALATKLGGQKLNYVIDIGIGGSNLGTKAIYEAMFGTLDGHSPFAPKMLFADTCSPELLSDIAELLLQEVAAKEEVVIVVASKSGTTTETMVNASVIISVLEKKFGSMKEQIVCITDEGSHLWETGKREGYHLLPIPKMVGGRYSVFSPVGMFPLFALGLDAEKLFIGAKDVIDDTVARGEESDTYRAALDVIAWHEKGARIFDMFLFHPELESLGKWYRQLFAESIGKETTKTGEKTTHRMVPTVSLGSTDLHSFEQMNLAFPEFSAKFLVRAHAPHWEHEFIADDKVFAPLVPGVSGRAPCQVMDAIYGGVIEAYRARGVSFAEVELQELSLEELGAFLQFHMCMVMHLANLLNVDAFNQPNVEEYKKATRRILEGEKRQ
ncbi:MAG: hypothetical protein AAB628_00510 [Patescibacteria group bacterium]